MFVTLLYSAGLPLLVPFACASLFVAYWTDKYLLLRFYATPPLVRQGVGILVSPSVMYASHALRLHRCLLFHMCALSCCRSSTSSWA
jgi:hypothetical protein